MDISIVGDIIRWPFEMLAFIIILLIKNFIPIAIIVSSVYFIYWIYSKGIIKEMSERIILAKKKKVENVVG